MHDLKTHSNTLPEQDVLFLGDAQYVYHCHHFNLFHDQTIEDALGEERAFEVRSRAAAEASRPLLESLAREQGAETPAERLQMAARLFPWMGHGKLEIQSDGGGGQALGEYLHYSFAWREKYGDKVRRRHPIDAFAAGWAAAATEVAHGLPAGQLTSRETACFARRDPSCRFEITPVDISPAHGSGNGGSPAEVGTTVGRSTVEDRVSPAGAGREEDTIRRIARGLKDYLITVEGDERGLVQGFGLYITRHLSSYYNATAYDTLHHIEHTAPQSAQVVEELLGESGHVCAFYTCGNILLSPEWEALVGPVRGEVEEIVASCVAIARALGFGHWTIEELIPDERLVLRATSNYEAPFYLARYGRSEVARSYFFANAARAFMQLAHRVDWRQRPQLDEALYQSLFKGADDPGWKVEQSTCLTRGDSYCEAIVTRA